MNNKFNYLEYEFEWTNNNFCKFTNIDLVVKMKHGNNHSSVLVNVLLGEEEVHDEFFNMQVSYREPVYSIGRMLNKREKLTDTEILISRSIDRIFRPLLIKYTKRQVSINITLIHHSFGLNRKLLASIGSIIAIKHLFKVEIGVFSKNSIFLAGNANDEIITLEVDSSENVLEDIENGLESCKEFIKIMNKIKSKGSLIKMKELSFLQNKCYKEFQKENNLNYEELRKSVNEFICESKKRFSERKYDEIRSININRVENGIVFSRGETTVLGFVTVGQAKDKYSLGDLDLKDCNIVSHYNFPCYATGELNNKNNTSRREIGHSDLIRKGFQNLIDKNIVVRLNSEVLSSNGSSSMASVCAHGIKLYEMGITSSLCAGISIGVFRNSKKHFIVVDMDQEEDKFSNVDLKVIGTKKEILAIQMDTKDFISIKELKEGIKLAKKAISSIIDKMSKDIQKPLKSTVSQISKTKLGLFIGTSGNTIKELSEITQCSIKTEQDGKVFISGDNIQPVLDFIKFYDEKPLQDNDKICFFLKEDSAYENKQTVLTTVNGKFFIDKKLKLNLKKGSFIVAKIDNILKKIIIFDVKKSKIK
jgi:polyribonucleotide nucleotidyltransferase